MRCARVDLGEVLYESADAFFVPVVATEPTERHSHLPLLFDPEERVAVRHLDHGRLGPVLFPPWVVHGEVLTLRPIEKAFRGVGGVRAADLADQLVLVVVKKALLRTGSVGVEPAPVDDRPRLMIHNDQPSPFAPPRDPKPP